MFSQYTLPYAYDALEPHLDALTVETHYGKHHAAYTNAFNAAAEKAGLTDKTAEEIGESALTLSAKAVTYGTGHWEVYPEGARGGAIVSPNSENTKINKLPVGVTQYAWIVVNSATHDNTTEVCDTMAIIKVTNNFVKAELSQPFYGTCGEPVTIKAIDPTQKYGSTVEMEWEFFSNDYNQEDVPTIQNADSYQAIVSDLSYNTTILKWKVKTAPTVCVTMKPPCASTTAATG